MNANPAQSHLLPRLPRFMTVTFLLLCAALVHAAPAAAPVCPFKADELAKVFGVRFEAGKDEGSAGFGSSCKYRSQGGSIKDNTELTLWVLVTPPGASQEMIRKLTAGPGAQFVPVKGDPDSAARVLHEDGMADVTYTRAGYVVFLRMGLSHEGDAHARSARKERFDAKLLSLPRVP